MKYSRTSWLMVTRDVGNFSKFISFTVSCNKEDFLYVTRFLNCAVHSCSCNSLHQIIKFSRVLNVLSWLRALQSLSCCKLTPNYYLVSTWSVAYVNIPYLSRRHYRKLKQYSVDASKICLMALCRSPPNLAASPITTLLASLPVNPNLLLILVV